MTRSALIIVDVQNDFCEGGSLAVEGGHQVAQRIADHLQDHAADYDLTVATYDWHQPDGPEHFAPEGTDPDYNETWPAHCVAGTDGAHNAPELLPALDAIDFIPVYKGQETAAFSGFEGVTEMDGHGDTLVEVLHDNLIDQVYICGLAYDYCVKATALDAAKHRYDTIVLRDLTAPVNPNNNDAVFEELTNAGVAIQ